MNLDDLTIGQAKELAGLFNNKCVDTTCPLPVGKKVFIRGVSLYYVGLLVAVSPDFLTLHDCAWVADTGRFSDALATGVLNEVEPFPPGPVYVNRGVICDLCEWKGTVPLVRK